jgi:hypothetical protein
MSFFYTGQVNLALMHKLPQRHTLEQALEGDDAGKAGASANAKAGAKA